MFGRDGRRGTKQRPAPEWPRRKMLALLVGAGICAMAMLIGLVLAVAYYLLPSAATHGQHAGPQPGTSSKARAVAGARATADRRDALAAEPMPTVDEDASHPGAVSTATPTAPLVVPTGAAVGPAHVPTGFPHTPGGALAQLAAIDQVAMQSLSLDAARQVIQAWAVRGGPTVENWSVIRGLAQLFTELGVSTGTSNQLALVLTPVMGQIKGSVGPDYVIPCIDFELDLTLTETARAATADCQRMVWIRDAATPATGCWRIGAGTEPVTPPSVWPDTDLAITVGYRDLRKES
jgi:hypothetical protein